MQFIDQVPRQVAALGVGVDALGHEHRPHPRTGLAQAEGPGCLAPGRLEVAVAVRHHHALGAQRIARIEQAGVGGDDVVEHGS